jgi:small-conductance mechanosensitive channel
MTLFSLSALAKASPAPAPPAAPPPTAWDSLMASWQPVVRWFDAHWGDIAVATGAALVLFAILYGLRMLARRREVRLAPDISLTDIFLRAAARTKTLPLVLVSLCLAIPYTSPPAAVLGLVSVTLTATLALQGAAWLRDILIGVVQRRAAESGSETLVNAMAIIRLLISVALFAIAAIIILSNIGVNVSGLIAGLGIGGIAIGLAAQGIFADLFAALSIIFDRPFSNGETIRYDTTVATVERVGLKSTRLRSVNGELLIISNTNLLNKEIANFARLERRRVQLLVGVVYQTTPTRLRALPALIERVIRACGHEFIRSSFTGFGASSLDFEAVFDVMSEDINIVAAGRTAVGIALFETMHAEGYEFAYPTQTTFTAAPDGSMILPYPEGGWGPATGENKG